MYKVVVIDDENLVRTGIVMGTDWSSADCMVVAEAGNGIEGLEAVRKYKPDLLVCDIRMPKMDGLEMLRCLREEKNDVAVIFLTAYGEFEYAQEAIKLYASDYILKPFEDGELEKIIARVTKRLEEERSAGKEYIAAGLIRESGDKSKYVMSAVSFIMEHYGDEELSVGMIAESLGVSEGHLSRMFKKETDYTVANYITRVRMREAMKLLSDCRMKVYEVAELVGYRDIAYFSGTFKKIVGISPSEYQDRCV